MNTRNVGFGILQLTSRRAKLVSTLVRHRFRKALSEFDGNFTRARLMWFIIFDLSNVFNLASSLVCSLLSALREACKLREKNMLCEDQLDGIVDGFTENNFVLGGGIVYGWDFQLVNERFAIFGRCRWPFRALRSVSV